MLNLSVLTGFATIGLSVAALALNVNNKYSAISTDLKAIHAAVNKPTAITNEYNRYVNGVKTSSYTTRASKSVASTTAGLANATDRALTVTPTTTKSAASEVAALNRGAAIDYGRLASMMRAAPMVVSVNGRELARATADDFAAENTRRTARINLGYGSGS